MYLRWDDILHLEVFSLWDINLTLGLLPPRRHVVWRDSVRHESLKNKVKFHLELFMTHQQIVTLNGYRFLDDLNSTKYWACDRQYFLQAIWFGVDLLLYHLQPVHASCSYRCICIQYIKAHLPVLKSGTRVLSKSI